MPALIAKADLMLNEDGSLYHINCRPGDLAETIIFVGDPDRVQEISKHFDRIELKKQKREFITHTGELGGRRLSVISTGIGVGNIDIVMNEVDAAFNVNLQERTVKEKITRLNIIRIGTTGGLLPDAKPGELIASTHAMSFDGVLKFYQPLKNDPDKELQKALEQHFAELPVINNLAVARGSEKLLKQFSDIQHRGITLTCAGFYGPQSRSLRLPLQKPDVFDLVKTFRYQNNVISNFEMETGAIYGFGKLLGHECCSISLAVNNRIKDETIKDFKTAMDNAISWVLERLN